MVGSVLLLAAGLSAFSYATSFTLSGTVRTATIVLSLGLPGLLIQDACRMALFTAGRARAATMNDAIWGIAQLTALTFVMFSGTSELWVFVSAWAWPASIAAIVGLVQIHTIPRLQGGWRWIKTHGELTRPLVSEFAFSTGTRQVSVYLVAAIGGFSVTGAIGAARMLLGPLNVLFMGAALIGVPEGARLRAQSMATLAKYIIWGSLALAGLAIVLATALYSLPSEIGSQILGSTWFDARDVLLLTGLSMAVTGFALGARIGLKVLESPKILLRNSLWSSPVHLGLTVIGVWLAGAQGAVAGSAAGNAFSSLLNWRGYRGVLRGMRV